jgi:hypothetical protein
MAFVKGFVKVIGVTAVGLAVGTAAVLAPLWLNSVGGASTGSISDRSANHWTDRAGHFARQIGGTVAGVYADFTQTNPTTSSGQGRTAADLAAASGSRNGALREISTQAHNAAAQSVGYLAYAPGASAARVSEPTTVQQPWTTQVTIEPETASVRKQTSSKPASEDQRRALVRDIQTELKRVGCFDGEPDGLWSAASKRAMASFTQRVNASLPFEQPDFILLTLVQGHSGSACGKVCANGQTLSETGRCQAVGIVAQVDRIKDKPRTERGDAPAKVAELPTVVRPSVGSAWTATVTGPIDGPVSRPLITGSIAALAPTPRPTVRRGTEVAATAPAPLLADRNAAPLPGRMTVGGPALVTAPEPMAKALPEQNWPKPASIRSQMATLDVAKPGDPPPTPVTESEVDDLPPQHVVRPGTANARPAVAARPRQETPTPTVVHRPAPQRAASSPAAKDPQFSSKQRRLVYEMFQRPDRN